MSAATKLDRKTKAAQLDEYDLTSSSTKDILIGSVMQMFERGTIRTQAAAGNLIKLIQDFFSSQDYPPGIHENKKRENIKQREGRKQKAASKEEKFTPVH